MAHHLLLKKGNIHFDLPAQWEVRQTIFREANPVNVALKDLMMEALAKPIGSPTLEQLLTPESKVAIVIDDLTRPTPISELLPRLLEIIEANGVGRDRIDIVIGNGTHRPMDKAEIEARVGPEVARAYRIQNHDARSPDLVIMGELKGYGPISFNATVAQADIKIIVGSIAPHVHNGFGGGPKNIMPGICDFDTIRQHHLKNALHPNARVGIVADNPFLEETVKIAKLAGVNFAIQCLWDAHGRICNVLAGDVFEVHQAAMKEESEQLGIPVSGKTDVTIVSSFPYDEGIQIMKASLPAAMVTKAGGTIFLVTGLTEPLPNFFLKSIQTMRGDDREDAQKRVVEKLNRHEPLVEGAGMDFTLAVVLIFCVSRQFNLTIVGHEVLKEAASVMGYGYSPDLNTALQKEKLTRKEPTVSIIPAGGYIFPIISEPFYLFGKE